jgi:RNA polymerase sigma factor (sigma-70 family)
MTDRELLDRFAGGAEPGAFDELVRRHLNLVYTAAQRQRPREADDVTQAVFLILAQKAGVVSRRSSLVGWLYRTTRYCCSNVRRTEDRRRQREKEAAAMAAEIKEAQSSELLLLLDDAVESLGQSEREAVLLRYLEAKSIEQTALELGISPSAAAKRASRGLEKLRMQFAKSGYGARAAGLETAMTGEAAKVAPAIVGQIIQSAVQKGGAGISPTVSSIMDDTKSMMRGSRLALVTALAAIFLVILAIGVFIAVEGPSSATTQQPALNPVSNIDSMSNGAKPAPVPVTVAPTTEPIVVDSDFECATPVDATVESANHVTVTLEAGPLDWWAFRLTGVKGKTVSIDIKPGGPRQSLSKWKALTAVYSYATDLDDPATFSVGPIDVDSTPNSQNVRVPNTDAQKWHYLPNCKLTGTTLYTITQTFTDNVAFIAERIPCPPGYNTKYINGLRNNPLAKVIDLRSTPEQRWFGIVHVGGDEPSQKTKPCVLLAAGEQAYQPDGMWVCDGAIDFLLGNSPEASDLRSKVNFLIIPMLDPDGTADSKMDFIGSFHSQRSNSLSVAYAEFLQKRFLAGERIDLVLELHSLQSGECRYLQRIEQTGIPSERPALISAFQQILVNQLSNAKMVPSRNLQNGGQHMPYRFGGWVSQRLGAMDILYEVNAQSPGRHLSLSQMRDTGRLFVLSCGEFFDSPNGKQLMASVDKASGARKTAWFGNPATNPSQDAIEAQEAVGGDNP